MLINLAFPIKTIGAVQSWFFRVIYLYIECVKKFPAFSFLKLKIEYTVEKQFFQETFKCIYFLKKSVERWKYNKVIFNDERR